MSTFRHLSRLPITRVPVSRVMSRRLPNTSAFAPVRIKSVFVPQHTRLMSTMSNTSSIVSSLPPPVMTVHDNIIELSRTIHTTPDEDYSKLIQSLLHDINDVMLEYPQHIVYIQALQQHVYTLQTTIHTLENRNHKLDPNYIFALVVMGVTNIAMWMHL